MKYDEKLVIQVSKCLQNYMHKYEKEHLTINEATTILDDAGILLDDVIANVGARLKVILGKGRDGEIPMVTGTYQKAKSSYWFLYRDDKFPKELKQHMIKKGARYID